MRRRLGEGSPEPLGVTLVEGGLNVAVFSAHASAIELCLFDAAGARELERIRLPEGTGDVFHGFVAGVEPGARYGLRAHGPFAPREGHRFNPAKLLLDPQARLLDRPFRLDRAMFGYPADADDLAFDNTDSAAVMPKAIVIASSGASTQTPLTAWRETLIYELHVKGFTKLHPGVAPQLRGTFAGLAQPAAIEHLVKLGVTTVELLPCAAWIDERHLAALGLTNYWGYNPVAWMAPEPRLAPGGWGEIRATVAALAAAGIETIVDVVLNHSGEGDELGPTLSLRGLDNASYYRLRDDPRFYVDDSGTGNTLALDRAPVVRLAMDALRTWVREAGVHGFRFDLATALGRRPDGFDPQAPLLTAIEQDPELRGLKLIAEPWDIGPGGYQLGRFPSRWGEWNDRFRDDIRRFWRGDAHRLGSLAARLAGSADVFGPNRPSSRSVNFVTAHDGFVLADLVAYEQRRNEANGEQNRDGAGANFSWDNGQEGPTDDPAIRAARLADQRALLATLLLARGTPMLAMGSELGHTQHGNNNAYCQDNPLSWLDWDGADAALLKFTRKLAAMRRKHALLRRDSVIQGHEVSWLTAAGQPMTAAEWDAPEAGSVAIVLHGTTEQLAILVHRGREPTRFTLPPGRWRGLIDSASAAVPTVAGAVVEVATRSVVLLAGDPQSGRNRGVSSATLQRLAGRAGIQPEWWSIDGIRHEIGEDTARHLLRAMRLPADSEAEARESLDRLEQFYDRRALPPVRVAREGEQVAFCGAGDTWLHVTGDIGESWNVCASAPLPPLPLGRYTVVREDAPDAPCRLTIAPHRAWLPDSIRSGERLFGIAAQLYSLRRAGDQGIGDFTTLAELVRHGGAAGADAIGLNPLHALFPEQRDRASPYSPSDRRFLDPIYLDVGPVAGAPDGDLVNYPAVWALKEAALRERFARDGHAMPPPGALRSFATFCALSRQFAGTPWQGWPAELRDPANTAVARFAAEHEQEVRFHAYLQQLCKAQLAAASQATQGMAVGLYGDLAVGAAPDGAEAWASQALLAQGVSIGAPPDPLGPAGQVWNLPPPDPHALAAGGYDAFAELLAANMDYAGALRIDHAMALSRLFWVPDGAEGKDGAYVSYPLSDLLGETALASVRARCLVVAEALGTVPEGFAEALAEADILSYRVLLLERESDTYRPPADYPRLSLACVTSHDLPPFAGWWQGADIAERAELGLVADVVGAEAARESDREALLRNVAGDVADLAGVNTAVHAAVAVGASALAMVQAEELALEERSVNMPGTDRERPNWRRRLAVIVDRLFTGEGGALLARVRALRQAGSGSR